MTKIGTLPPNNNQLWPPFRGVTSTPVAFTSTSVEANCSPKSRSDGNHLAKDGGLGDGGAVADPQSWNPEPNHSDP